MVTTNARRRIAPTITPALAHVSSVFLDGHERSPAIRRYISADVGLRSMPTTPAPRLYLVHYAGSPTVPFPNRAAVAGRQYQTDESWFQITPPFNMHQAYADHRPYRHRPCHRYRVCRNRHRRTKRWRRHDGGIRRTAQRIGSGAHCAHGHHLEGWLDRSVRREAFPIKSEPQPAGLSLSILIPPRPARRSRIWNLAPRLAWELNVEVKESSTLVEETYHLS